MTRATLFICIFGILLNLNSCDNLAFVEKEQELVSFYKNEYPVDTRIQQVYTVLTYNIHMGFTAYQSAFRNKDNTGGSPEHLDSLALAIKSIDPDFVALQDVGMNVTHTWVKDQAAYLANALKMNYAYADYSEVNTGNDLFIRGTRAHVLLTKYEIQNIENIEILNQNRYESRYCQVVNIKINEQQSISLLNTHFRGGTTEEEKFHEANQILGITETQQNPIIICGDFNNTINSPAIAKINNFFPSVLTLVSNAERIEVESNFGKIDNIFVDEGFFKVEEIGLVLDEFKYLSDHRLLFARFTF